MAMAISPLNSMTDSGIVTAGPLLIKRGWMSIQKLSCYKNKIKVWLARSIVPTM